MTEFCRRMLNEDEPDSPEACRERRRRRIEMRRVAATAATAGAEASAAEEAERRRARSEEAVAAGGDEESVLAEIVSSGVRRVAEAVASSSRGDAADKVPALEPVFGKLSVPGRSRYMEDAVSVKTGVALPEITRSRAVHFFAVYDGHGGPHVAELCKERMHVIMSEEMGQLRFTRGETLDGGERAAEEEEWWWRRVMKRSFARMDDEAMNTCTCGGVRQLCGCQLMEVAVGGSTAAVAVLTPDHIVVANVGDSRCVLRRGSTAVPLSQDHKPDRSDERARIEAAGGRVIFVNGARVEGILAMSRAIGDRHLKQYVISDPEITFTKREPGDECLIIASDGLWDVLSSELACRVAGECLCAASVEPTTRPSGGPQREDARPGALYQSRSALTAAILTRLALGRKSSDNITVIVVDLKRS